MTARKRSASTSNKFSLFFFLGLVLLLPAVVYAFQRISLDNRSQAAYSAADFVQTQGKNLVYQGKTVILKGANFDNIPAMGAGIGANSVDRMNISEIDYQKMAEFGGNHARLGLSYSWYEQDKAKFFAAVDKQVAYARKHGIWVSLLTFTNPDGNDGCYEGYSEVCSIWTNKTYQDQLANFWVDVSARYKNEAAVVGYDIINEPNPQGPDYCRTWFNLAQSIRNKVAATAPNQLVFISACSDPSFDRVFKEADNITKAKNVVYEVHDYDPMRFSHVGYKELSKLSQADLAALPSYPGNATAWVDGVQRTFFFDKTTFEGTRYPQTPDKGGYSTAAQYSIKWANDNNVPIYIGEWGAQGWLKNHDKFIRDKAEVYNALGVNHAYYTWRHQVTDGWRWGLFARTGAFEVPDEETQRKIDAFKVSLANAVRPQFEVLASITPQPTVAPPSPSVAPTPLPTPSPSLRPTPVPTPTPQPTILPTPTPPPVTSAGYPRVLQSTNSKIKVLEEKAANGSTIFLKVETDPPITTTRVAWYINGKWAAEDAVAPYYLGGDQNGVAKGFTVPSYTTQIRSVVYYNTNDNFIDTTTNYPFPAVVQASPTPPPTNTQVKAGYEIVTEWPQGYCARIVITNNTAKEAKSWKVSFNKNDSQIYKTSNGTFRNLLGKITVTPNSDIKWLPANSKNSSVEYCANKKGNNWQPSNFNATASF